MGEYMTERRAVHEAAVRMYREKMVVGSAGNVSCRVPETAYYAITPTSKNYETMTPEDVVVIDGERDLIVGERGPSFEADVHLAVYKARPDAHAIFHTHSLYSTICAVAGEDVPPLVEEVVVYVGGPIKVADYGVSGSDELADAVVRALEDRAAVLMRNHGLLAVGKDLERAFRVAQLVERAAQVYVFARLLGKVNPLPDSVLEMEREFYNVMKGT